MAQNRKNWNQQQQVLRKTLSKSVEHQQAIELFLSQHAMVHSAAMSGSGLWSFEDEVWRGLDNENARQIPEASEHSIAWIMWHITRIEDITMNVLLAGRSQMLFLGAWYDRLGIPFRDTGNAMNMDEVVTLSKLIDIKCLQEYRIAIGIQTRKIVSQLHPADLKQKVNPSRLQWLLDEGAVVEAARGVIEYWGVLTHAGLLLMPPTRHNLIHLNEALRLKKKIIGKV
jgi:hypothetical protein